MNLASFKVCHNIDNWLVIGDFNTPLHDVDKVGGSQNVDDSRSDLMQFINDSALLDLDLKGASYTWSNRHVGDALIQVKLDHALLNPKWLVHYSCSLSSLTRLGSNHFPLALSMDLLGGKKNFPFRFEKMWTCHPNLGSLVKDWWSIDVEGLAMYKVVKNLANVKLNVQKWNRISFGHIFQKKEGVSKELHTIQQVIQSSGYNQDLMLKENVLLSKLHNIIAKEEEFWKQQSRIMWLKSNDRNSKFFHISTLKHRASNRINLINFNNQALEKDVELQTVAASYCSQLLSVEGVLDGACQEDILRDIP